MMAAEEAADGSIPDGSAPDGLGRRRIGADGH